MDLPEPLTDFTIIILPRKLTGHFLYVWAIWNMSVLQDSLTTISWNSLRVKNYHIMSTNQDFQFTRVVSERKIKRHPG